MSPPSHTLIAHNQGYSMVNGDIANRLWAAADLLWTNSGLRPAKYSGPVLGLIFLRYAEKKFAAAEEKIGPVGSGSRRKVSKADYEAEGVIFLRPEARFSYLQKLPESENLGKKLNEAMQAIEDENQDLRGVLSRTYTSIENAVLVELLKILAPVDLSGDAFGKVYEYFLGEFAREEGQKGGVFYTPESIVKLIVEIIQPFHGRILDPACGSGGMFVHSAAFVERRHKSASNELSIYGIEKDETTVNLNKMNLAVHGLTGDVRVANTYYDRPEALFSEVFAEGGFDFVMANPPFNAKSVDKERLEGDKRFAFGLPNPDNANYLWIQQFYSALNTTGRAGFVMANSAGDARGSEQNIREKLIASKAVDVIVSVGSNFFYTVTLPCTLWFFDKAKASSKRGDTVLFIDARHIYRQLDRAHRDFLPEQIELLANIVRLYRGQEPEFANGGKALLAEKGFAGGYVDILGLCKVATITEIKAQGWSLNPGRYVGATEREDDGVDFAGRLEELNEELELLNVEARELEARIAENVAKVLEGAI